MEKTKGTTHTTNQKSTAKPARRNSNVHGAKGLRPNNGGQASTRANNHDGKASARSKLQPTRRRRQSIRQAGTAAKHPPAKTIQTTKRDPDDADEMKQRQAQKHNLSEESRWPPPAKLPRQRLQEGNDATDAAVVRPKMV